MELTIKGNDKKRLRLIEKLAKELGLAIEKTQMDKKMSSIEKKASSEELYELMEEMAASGGIESIEDPVAWQRQIRKDKKLYGRE